ncbi:phospholipase A2, partial [Candidatus Hydrogenedentota bacterium]
SYVHDPSRIIGTALGRRYAGFGYWNFHQDHLGSTRFLTAENEGLGLAATYGPYGDIIRHGGQSHTPDGMFTGKTWDQTTGMHYFPYRYMSSQWGGRWTQRDRMGMIDGPNLYGYANAAPSQSYDTFGLVVGTKDYCGSDGSEWVPDKPGGFDFRWACKKHDDCYGDCEGQPSKWSCDWQFLKDMLDYCSTEPIWRRDDCQAWAIIYFSGVRDFAGSDFERARSSCVPHCEPEAESPGPPQPRPPLPPIIFMRTP